jgi:glyoxylase-like metal-dependent hydrolase (beta-lactamase superfamily II)
MKVERFLAPNPGPFTGPGTNTYVVSSGGRAVVLDPGPLIDAHVADVEGALSGLDPVAVLVTHTHPDHAPAANLLGERLGVEVLGFGPGPEFSPTRSLGDGERVVVGEVELVAVHTPGHTADHLCYRIADVLFTGDHIMGGSTVIIEDAAAYMASLQRVAAMAPAHLYPGHGPEMPEGARAVADYIEHRLEREHQIVAAVERGAVTADDIAAVVYAEVPEVLRPAAAAQVRVQLVKLAADGRIALHPAGGVAIAGAAGGEARS